MVEHSAILISKILKGSNRHFSFDGWYGPVPPTVMSQQWPAPAVPLRGDVKGVEISDLRNDATLAESVSHHLTRRHDVVLRWSHFKKGKKGKKWHHSALMSLSCSFISFIRYYYFVTQLQSLLHGCTHFVFLPELNMFSYFSLSLFQSLHWPWADWARLIAAQMEGKEET